MEFLIYFEDRAGEFADGLDVYIEKQKGVKTCAKIFSLGN